MKIKNIIYSVAIILLFLGLLFISVYYKEWWLLVLILIIVGFLLLLSFGFEQGFRDKFPLDFLVHTKWVNDYFVQNGFIENGYNLEDSNYPATNFIKGQTRVMVRLNAPLHSKKYSISVIVDGDVEKEWKFDPNTDKDNVYKSFDEFFNHQ